MGRQGPIGHVDADAFYVAAERVRYAHLVGMPVGVLGNQGACVIAKSYEMKAGTDRLRVTHPDRLKVTHLGLEDGHPGQGW